MLEGNEIEGKIGEVGTYVLDVTTEGVVKFSAVVDKDFGYAKVSSMNTIESNIIAIAEAVAAKTNTVWDDNALKLFKSILGIV